MSSSKGHGLMSTSNKNLPPPYDKYFSYTVNDMEKWWKVSRNESEMYF